HMLARAHHLLALTEVHLGRGSEDHGVGALDALAEIAGVMEHAVFLGDLRRGVLIAADQRGHFYVGNALERVEMFLAKGTLPGNADFHGGPLKDSHTGVIARSEATTDPERSRLNCFAWPAMTVNCECDAPWPAQRRA